VQGLRAGQTATDSFTYTMRDAAGATSSTTLTVTVTGTNDGPVAVANTAAVQEDVTTSASGNVLTNDTDADVGDTKTVSAVNGGAGNVGVAVAGTYGSATINADGSYSYTLNNASAAVQGLRAGQTATDSFTYTMRDAAGATSSTTLTVTVTGTNDGPVVNAVATPTVYFDSNGNGQFDSGEASSSFTSGTISSGTETTHTRHFDIPTTADPGNTKVVISFATIDNSGTVLVNGTNIASQQYLEFENANFNAATDAHVTFADGTDANQPWVANTSGLPRIEIRITEHGIEIWGTRTSASVVMEQMVLQNGSLVLPNITTGQNTLQIINHNDNGPDGMNATITVTNDPLQDRSYSENQTVSFNVSSGFSDIDIGDTMTYGASGLPQGLAINPSTGLVSGTIANNAAGTYTVTFSVNDGNGGTASDTVTFTVGNTNVAPTSLSLTNSSVVENAPTGYVVGYVTPVDADMADTLTYSFVGASGPFAIDAVSGVITVNGALDYETTSSFNVTVRVTDSSGSFIDQAVTLSVLNATEGNNGTNNITGTSGNDIIFGFGGNDTINGGNGNDLIIGDAGNDTLNGGAGTDTLSYMTSASGVNVNLNGTVSGGDAAGDSISNFENITGSNSADTLTGNNSANVLTGLAGNDTISGGGGSDTIEGGAGADTLDGGAGTDILSYASSTAGVTVNLATNTASGGHATGDIISNFESILGSNNNDVLTGNSSANTITGGGGDDTINGGLGNDTLAGGAGHDLFIYQVGQGNDSVNGGAGASWMDVIRLLDSGGGSNLVYGVDWTLSLTSGSITHTDTTNGIMNLTADSDGSISLTSGGTVTFTDIERINW
ncbi:MAG TPA: VCBS domain-containing protein, partial [Aestuariivirgaceae bacterium]